MLSHPSQLAAVAMAAQCPHLSTGQGEVHHHPATAVPRASQVAASLESISPLHTQHGVAIPRVFPPHSCSTASRVVLAVRQSVGCRGHLQGAACVGPAPFLLHWDPSQGQGGWTATSPTAMGAASGRKPSPGCLTPVNYRRVSWHCPQHPHRLAQLTAEVVDAISSPPISSLAVALRLTAKTPAGRMLHPHSISTAPAPAAGLCSYVFKKGLGWGGRSVSIQPFSRNLVRFSASKRLPELALWPPPAPGQGSRHSIPAVGARGTR